MSTLTASNGALYLSTSPPISRSVKEILLNKSEICHNEDHWEKLLILPIPIISLLMNLVLFMAGHIYRRKLRRHNYLYGCVSSTLLSNILYLVFHIWILLDNYFRNSKIYARHSGPIWIVCQAAVVSLQFVMFGNIVALLIITLDSTYFVGRSVNKKATDFARDHLGNNYAEKEKTWYRSVKRRRAAFLVAGAWIIPLCTTTAAAVSWNCVENCVNCEGREISDPCPHNPHCSRLWAPLHNDFLGVNVALWFVDVLVLIYVIISGIHSFRQVMVPNSSHNNLSQPNTIPLSNVKPTPRPELNSDETETKKSSPSKVAENKSDVPLQGASTLNRENNISSNSRHPLARRYASIRYHPRIIFMIIISTAVVIGTLPMILTTILDITKQNLHFEAARISSTLFTYAYTIASAIILPKYLPNLYSAVNLMFRNCSCSRIASHKRLSTMRSVASQK